VVTTNGGGATAAASVVGSEGGRHGIEFVTWPLQMAGGERPRIRYRPGRQRTGRACEHYTDVRAQCLRLRLVARQVVAWPCRVLFAWQVCVAYALPWLLCCMAVLLHW
jgi:hypothetical protein